jgi:hypothetical protein
MNNRFSFRAALLASALIILASPSALAEAETFSFELVEPSVTVGDGVAVTVRLLDRAGAPATGAIIYDVRLDMAPDDMAAMTAPVQPAEELGDGLYRLRADLIMDGNWRLQLAAKVQGQSRTVTSELPLEVVP